MQNLISIKMFLQLSSIMWLEKVTRDHHEAGEDHSQRRRSRGGGQDGRPEEDEDVHAALDDALHQPDQEDGAVAPDQQRPLAVGRNQVDALFEIKHGSLSHWHCFGQWLWLSRIAHAS